MRYLRCAGCCTASCCAAAQLVTGTRAVPLTPSPLRPLLTLPDPLALLARRSEEWLSGVEAADGATRRILAVYARHAVVPLVETEVATPQALERVTQLLVLGDSGDGGGSGSNDTASATATAATQGCAR